MSEESWEVRNTKIVSGSEHGIRIRISDEVCYVRLCGALSACQPAQLGHLTPGSQHLKLSLKCPVSALVNDVIRAWATVSCGVHRPGLPAWSLALALGALSGLEDSAPSGRAAAGPAVARVGSGPPQRLAGGADAGAPPATRSSVPNAGSSSFSSPHPFPGCLPYY